MKSSAANSKKNTKTNKSKGKHPKSMAAMQTEKASKKLETIEVGPVPAAKTPDLSKLVVEEKATAETTTAPVMPTASNTPAGKLAKFHLWAGILLAIQAVIIALLSEMAHKAVTIQYMAKDALGSDVAGGSVYAQATQHLFDVNLVQVVSGLLLLAAIIHIYIGTSYRPKYEAEIEEGFGKARWAHFALVGTGLVALTAFMVGVSDIATLIAIKALIVIAAVSAFISLKARKRSTPNIATASFIVSCGASIVAWIVISLYVIAACINGELPAYAYGIYASMLALYVVFAAVKYLHYKGRGRFASELFTERAYLVWSFVALTALVWQIFAGVLRP